MSVSFICSRTSRRHSPLETASPSSTTNEKVALEVALGAAIGGGRSFVGMKHVGLNVAADPLFITSYTSSLHTTLTGR